MEAFKNFSPYLNLILGLFVGLLVTFIRGLSVNQRKLERELLVLKADLPQQYVGRDDWIRFGVGIDAKMDKLHEKIDGLRKELNGGT